MSDNISAAKVNRKTLEGKMIASPVFLVGAERSGSTMLRLMLNDHPDVCWLNEFEYAVDQLNDDGTCYNLQGYREWLSCHRTFTATGFTINENLDYHHLVNSFLLQKQKEDGKQFVGATVHRYFDRLLTIWPEAKFIHILRDPRDVSRSVLNMGWVGHIYYGSDRWIGAEKTWDRLAKSISSDRYVEIRFEKLLDNPLKELMPAWRLMGVDPAKYAMKYWENTTYSAPNPKLSYQWKRKLTPHEVQLIESRTGQMLKAKGFDASGFKPIKLERADRVRLSILNRIGRAMKRRSRYGTQMWIASIIAPRTPFKKWRRSIRLRLNEIERTQLK